LIRTPFAEVTFPVDDSRERDSFSVYCGCSYYERIVLRHLGGRRFQAGAILADCQLSIAALLTCFAGADSSPTSP